LVSKDGDYVEKDQAVAEVDSDKALELQLRLVGYYYIKAEEGDAASAVGAVVCLIDIAAKPEDSA
jgi:2-oxoglutarate dehydrogenase E2 component (dihydrolipoamide succinyltransferase)